MLKLVMSDMVGAIMKYSAIFFLAVVTAVFLCPWTTPAAEDTDPLEELIRRQHDLLSVHATFTQEQHDPMLGRPIKNAGEFYFMAGEGVRWEYEDALVIYDGSVLYVYSPETNEARKIKGEKGFMGPLAFDVKELLENYDVEAGREGDVIRLILRPKAEMPFSSMSMIFPGDMAFPSEVAVMQETGERALIKFDNIQLNAKFSDEMFKFRPPPGTEIMEGQFE